MPSAPTAVVPGRSSPTTSPKVYRTWLLAAVLFVLTYFATTQVLSYSCGWSVFLSLLAAYLPSYFDGAQYACSAKEGSRFWPALAFHPLWTRVFSYFPSSLINSSRFDYAAAAAQGGQFVFAVHPHGMLSLDHFLIFTDAVGFMSKVAPVQRRDLGASVIFRIPLLREICLWLGTVDAGARTAHHVLSQGYSMQLFPGGIQEQIATNSNKPIAVAKDRTGFVKLALQYNLPIVPVYCFGEDKLYTSLSFLHGLRSMLVRTLRIGITLFFGRPDTLGLLPYKRPLVAVMGEPLWPEGMDAEKQKAEWERRGRPTPGTAGAPKRTPRTDVSKEEIHAMCDRYVQALDKLFEQHKKEQPGYENATLEIRSAQR